MEFCHRALMLLIVLFGLLHSIVECRMVPSVAAEEPCKFSAIFNFGDSNSDTGGLSALFGQEGSPNGETFFHRPVGRYCDGRLKIDLIAESLGLPLLSPYLDAVGTNFTHGANFATAGSTIRPLNVTWHNTGYSPVSLLDQSREFSDFHWRAPSLRQGVYTELLPTAEVFSDALYTFDIGQNDLTACYFGGMSLDDTENVAIPDLILKFSGVIRDIYNNQGGRYFWIHNTGPVGCLPYVMDRLSVTAGQVDHIGCSNPYNDGAKYFNSKLKEAVSQLREELPLAAITYVDVNSVMYDLYTHGTKYGFIHRLKACCGHGGKYNYNANIGCGSPLGQSCKDPSRAINWDGYHYTEAGNKWVVDRIVNGSYSDPPIPLHMACRRSA